MRINIKYKIIINYVKIECVQRKKNAKKYTEH